MEIIRIGTDNTGKIKIHESFEFDGIKIDVGISKEGVSMVYDGVELNIFRHFEKQNIPNAIEQFKIKCENTNYGKSDIIAYSEKVKTAKNLK